MKARHPIALALVLAGLLTGRGLAAAELSIPSAWLRAAPGPNEATAIEQGAARHGWPAMAAAMRAGALATYARGDLANAQAWATAARWAAMWGTTEGEEAVRWRAAMEAEGWPGAKIVPREPDAPDRPLAERLPAVMRAELLADIAWSGEFFSLLNPVDQRAEVLGLLARLREKSPGAWSAYPRLAMAIALVHDTAPPIEWPHWQVSPAALPRRLAPAGDVWLHLASLSREGKALWGADRLEAAELRFVVDLVLPEDERAWALAKVKTSLGRLAETYSMIRYRTDRIDANVYVWPGPSYRLADILAEGGICVDQAYFATQAGKARGVPTLLFAGAGRDGRHAWFGFLGTGRKWVMDAGRYESQNYVTGVAHDPQTWMEVSDHELKFLSEGFRRERNARDARTHADFARWLLDDGRTKEAESAARAAIQLERRTLEAWEVLLALRPQPGEAREAVARDAALRLSSYPDLQSKFTGIVTESLRARGEHAEADRITGSQARRFAGKRGDLSIKEISAQMTRAAASATIEEQVRLYRNLLRRFGAGAGADMWDQVVRPFALSLAGAGRLKEAREAVVLARKELEVPYGSQMDTEMRAFEARLNDLMRQTGGNPGPK